MNSIYNAKGGGRVRAGSVLICFFFLIPFFTFLKPCFCKGDFYGSLTVDFDSPSFFKEFKRTEIRDLFIQLLENRLFACQSSRITLKGSPEICNVEFEFNKGTIFQKRQDFQSLKKEDGQGTLGEVNPGDINDLKKSDLIEVSFQFIKGRIPVGNLLLLVRDRMKWPVSVVVKDLKLQLSVDSFSKIIIAGGSVKKMVIVAADSTCKSELGISWSKDKNNEFLVKNLYERGLSLVMERQFLYLRNVRDSSLMILSGHLPQHMGVEEVHLIGLPVAIPGGAISFKSRALVKRGVVEFSTPLLKIAEGVFGRNIDSFTDFTNEAFNMVSFVDEVSIDDTNITLTGIGLLNLLDCVRERQIEKWNSSRPSLEPSLILNRLH